MVYLGVALTTLATLLLELALTRIFSVVFYYHFAFLAISVALFGLGVGGVLSYVVAARPGSAFRKLGALSLANGAVVVLSLWFLLTRSGNMTGATLAAVYIAASLPFIVAGIVVSLAISETIERVDRVYFFDLIGAAGGCLLLIPLLKAVNGPNTVICAGALFAAAGAIWYTLAGSPRGRITAVAAAVFIVGFAIYNQKGRLIDVKYAKDQELRNEQYVKWNGISRIAVAPDSSGMMTIFIDADASTGIFDRDLDNMDAAGKHNLLREGPGIPYSLRPAAKTLIIGPGGGWDVARALASGSKDITGVEINPIIIDNVMRDKQRYKLSRGLYFRPEVKIFKEDGRSFVRRSPEKYTVLQATLVDTWASTAAGAFSLSENSLYTTDAFHDYLSHLTDDGVMAFTRWGFDPPRESLRLLTLAMDALARLGEKEAWKHVVVARENAHLIGGWGARDTVLISRKPLSDADVARMREILVDAKMQAVYLPGDTAGPFAGILRTADLPGFLRAYQYDVSPLDDNRPFFFYTVQPRDVWNFVANASQESADFKINRAVPLLFRLVAISLGAVLVMLVLPPLLLGSKLPTEPGVRMFLLYFVCIGIGYILVQVALIQKFVLFLGHPAYALSVIVFSMLVASGAGSFYSRRAGPFEGSKLNAVLVAVAAVVTMLAFAVGPVTAFAVGWPLALRMLIAALLIAPAAFLMGMPFPSGLARLEAWHNPSVRWAWSLNAAASVLGSVLAIFLALYLGLRETLLAGGGLYLCALAALRACR